MVVCVIKRGSDIEGQVVGSVSLLLMRGSGDIKSYGVEVPSCQELHLRTNDLITSLPRVQIQITAFQKRQKSEACLELVNFGVNIGPAAHLAGVRGQSQLLPPNRCVTDSLSYLDISRLLQNELLGNGQIIEEEITRSGAA